MKEAGRPLEHLHPLDVVEVVEGDLRLRHAVGEDQAAGERVEAPDAEEIEEIKVTGSYIGSRANDIDFEKTGLFLT